MLSARIPLGVLALTLGGAAAQSTPVTLMLDAVPISGSIPPTEWKDYVVTLSDRGDDNCNILFQVNATTEYANGLGIYVSEELPPIDQRLNPGQFLDYDAQSVIVIDGVRQYSVALSQCYVRRGQTYYLSVFGKNVVGPVTKPTVPYTISVKRVRAQINMTTATTGGQASGTVTGTVCDGHYMHFFWELDAIGSGGVRTEVSKVEGELDAAYMRYEHCAGLAGANLASVPLEGHGTPSGSIVLPQDSHVLEDGRYYVSIKAKPEICGDFKITATRLSQVQLLASPAPALRSGGIVTLFVALLPAWLLGRSLR